MKMLIFVSLIMIVMSTLLRFQDFHKNNFNEGYVSGLHSGKLLRLEIFKKINNKDDIKEVEKFPLDVISGTVKFSYEALLPLFALGGHEFRVMLYIISYCANKETLDFKWTKCVADDYIYLYEVASGKEVKPDTVRQAIITLTKEKIITKISKTNYMLNPLYSARPGKYETQGLFKKFLNIPISTGKTISRKLLSPFF
jgi:hypothetical protein